MKSLIFFCSILFLSSAAVAQTKNTIQIDCVTSGLNIETLTSSNKIQEKLVYEYGETKDGYKYSKTEFRVNGNELKGASVISRSDSYILTAAGKSSGTGYGKKVYMFTNFYDMEAKEVIRQATTFPDGLTEKTVGKCSINSKSH